jgi:hypothetical protein
MIDKVRKEHSKKTQWGEHDRFAKAAKKAGKRIRQSEEDDENWQDQIRYATHNAE